MLRDEFWVPAAGVHSVDFALVYMLTNLAAQQISGAVGRSAGQDVAERLGLLDLLDGLHQSDSFTLIGREIQNDI